MAYLFFITSTTAHAAGIALDEAANHLGQTEMVCETVASAHYAPHSRVEPTSITVADDNMQTWKHVSTGDIERVYGVWDASIAGSKVGAMISSDLLVDERQI